jgi:hypothetical protein
MKGPGIMSEIAHILAEITRTADPVGAIRSCVLARGGTWPDAEIRSGLFEIQLAGLVGLGASARTAVEDWILQAKAHLRAAAMTAA